MGDYCFCDTALLRRQDAYFMWAIIARRYYEEKSCCLQKMLFLVKIRKRKSYIALCY